MTPAQYKLLSCPIAKVASIPTLAGIPITKYLWVGTTDGCAAAIAGVNRDASGFLPGTQCLADGCMAWEWSDDPPTEGFCSKYDQNAQKE